MKFSNFLQEQKEKHAVMAFGRMNPITSGHEKLVNKVKDIAKSVGGSAHIVVSHSQDPSKNPLSAAQKLKHAKRAFPGVNVSASDPSAPHFLAQAAKLHKQGVTHFHMVGGQDRVEEFHKLLHRYNGVKGPHGSFNFKKIEVHSAGDRDPDAEGVEGMSASKMREHASKGNFNEFKKGVPSSMSHSHAKEMYNDVRRGMNIKEDINVSVEELLNEGVHDQAIFKAVFLAGGPGSGKDYVLDNTLNGHGLTEINSDKALEFLMDKSGLDKTMPSSEKEKRDVVRGRAKSMTELRQRLALLGRNGLIINGTGDDYDKIKRIKDRLEEIGYDTSMIMVNTDDEVSKQRNIERGQRGGRTVPEEIRKQKWESVQASRPELAKIFGDRYVEFDNSEDLRQAPPDVVKAKKDEMLSLYKGVKDFIAQPPKSEAAAMWVAHQMSEKDTLPIPQEGAEKPPHPESAAAEEARKLGLQYYGFGRYGRNGKVTHRSVHDRLVDVQREEPQQSNISAPKLSNTSKDKKDSDFDKIFKEENNPRIPKKPGQPDKSDKHSDLYTDEDPKGTIHGLKFATPQDAEESVRKIKSSTRSHAHKIQAAIAMEQRAKVMGKSSAAAIYRTFINSMKEKTKEMQKEAIDEDFEEMFAEDLRQWFDPKHPKGGWKRINSKGEAIGPCAREPGEAKPKCMSNEKRAKLSKKERAAAVSAKRRHDPNPERKGKPINVSNFGKGKLSESYQLSDSGALNLLLLGTRIDEIDYQIGEEKEKTKLLKDKAGKVRTFMLRSAAAREAHTINGTVIPYKNGYVIKLNEENDNVSISENTIRHQENRRITISSFRWSGESSAGENGQLLREGVAELTSGQEYAIHFGINELQPNQDTFGQAKKRKVSVEEIRRKQKEKVKESIDKGIEPGLSMATSGENLLRPSNVKNKQVKKPFEEMIGDGGEMLQSMADKKEDDLKKIGINLKSWKSKKFVG